MTFSVLLIKPLSTAKINVGVKAKSTLWFPNMHQSAEMHPETSSPFGICNWCYSYLLFINLSLWASGCDWNSMTLLLFCFLVWSSRWLVAFSPSPLPRPTHCIWRWGDSPVCAFTLWRFSSLAGGWTLGTRVSWESWQRGAKGSVLLCLHGLPEVIFCTCWACATAKARFVYLCLALRGEGGSWEQRLDPGGTGAPCLSCSQSHCPEQYVLGLSWRGLSRAGALPLSLQLCGCLFQLCCERYWSRCCLCSFPSIAHSVQERGWGWNNLCLVELSHALQVQPAGFVTPGENSWREYLHCALVAEPHIPQRAPQPDTGAGSIMSCISALPYCSLALVSALSMAFCFWDAGEDLCTQIHRSRSYRHSSEVSNVALHSNIAVLPANFTSASSCKAVHIFPV